MKRFDWLRAQSVEKCALLPSRELTTCLVHLVKIKKAFVKEPNLFSKASMLCKIIEARG